MGTRFEQPTTTEVGITSQVMEALEGGRYPDALELIRADRSSRPRNVYLIAAERQVLRLSDLSSKGGLERRRTDELVSLIAALLERVEGPEGTAPSVPRSDRRVARSIGWDPVKQRYLQYAREFEFNGDIDHALLEVRRALQMDPADPGVRDYEQRLVRIQSISLSTLEAAEVLDGDVSPVGKGVLVEDEPVIIPPPPTPESALESIDAIKELEPQPQQAQRPAKFWISRVAAVVVVVAALMATDRWIDGTQTGNVRNMQPAVGIQGNDLDQNGPRVNGLDISITKPWEHNQVRRQSTAPQKERTAPTREGRQYGENTSDPESQRRANSESEAPNSTSYAETRNQRDSSSATISDLAPVVAVPPETAPLRSVAAVTKRETVRPPAVTTLISEAQLTKLARPDYPAIARLNRAEGKVTVRVLIDSSGSPLRAEIASSTNPLFNEAATKAALNSTFSPRVTSLGPTQAWALIPFNFSL
jgi:TonB family protein